MSSDSASDFFMLRSSPLHEKEIISKIIHQFGGTMGRGKICKNNIQKNLGNLTPTKRKLFQNQNLQTLINSFESIPGESNLKKNVTSESLAKRRKWYSVVEVVNPIGQGHGDGSNFVGY